MTYEYVCGSCGHEWEAQQSIKDSPLKDCPKCGGAEARRQISKGTGFILKGGGWYSDLYSSSGASKSATASSSSAESTSSTSSTTPSTGSSSSSD